MIITNSNLVPEYQRGWWLGIGVNDNLIIYVFSHIKNSEIQAVLTIKNLSNAQLVRPYGWVGLNYLVRNGQTLITTKVPIVRVVDLCESKFNNFAWRWGSPPEKYND